MSDLIDRKAILKHIEKIRQGVQMMDDTRRASIIMNGMYLCEKAVRNQSSAQPEIIRCKDCKHKPHPSDNYDYDNGDCGFEIIFPDYRCPCRCDDEYYNRIPDDDWFCGNAERRTDG